MARKSRQTVYVLIVFGISLPDYPENPYPPKFAKFREGAPDNTVKHSPPNLGCESPPPNLGGMGLPD